MLDEHKGRIAKEGSKRRSERLSGAGKADTRQTWAGPRPSGSSLALPAGPKGFAAFLVRLLRRWARPGAGTAGGVPRNALRNPSGQCLAGRIPKNRRAILQTGPQLGKPVGRLQTNLCVIEHGRPVSFKQTPVFVRRRITILASRRRRRAVGQSRGLRCHMIET